MLTSIISALHRGQAGRPIAANGMTDDRAGHDASLDIGGSTTLSVTGNALGGSAVIIQVCASGGLKRESNSLAPTLKLCRNQVALASHAVAGIDRHSRARKPNSLCATKVIFSRG